MITKKFRYDEILDAENICNLDREKEELLEGIGRGDKLVVYGQRNSGKTSLVQSVIIPEFRKRYPEAFVMFCDLMEVKDRQSIDERMSAQFSVAFAAAFPAKAWVNAIKKYLRGIHPTIKVDAVSAEPTLSLSSSSAPVPFTTILRNLRINIAAQLPVLVVLDEFQDISFVPEAQGLFREELQKFRRIPVILMGSKRHILGQMFSKPAAPFADFGYDVEFKPIPYENYHPYIQERFAPRQLKITFETAKKLQDLLNRNPEAINTVGAYIADHFMDQEIAEQDIRTSIMAVIAKRQSRFEQLLAFYEQNAQTVLTAIAKQGPIKHPTSKEFLRTMDLSHGTVLRTVAYLMDHGVLEHNENGYQLNNPLLRQYLAIYR